MERCLKTSKLRIGELAFTKATDFLRIRYGGTTDAKRSLGGVEQTRAAFNSIRGHRFR